jgi:uncharacterized membrane protein YkoI
MKTWKKLFPILAVALIAVSAIAYAQTNTPTLTTSSNINVDEQYPSYVSSIQVPASYSDQQLVQLAKVNSTQAKESALSKVTGGTVTGISLENENGNLVYSVQITKGSINYDVKIDAGNGNILFIEQSTGNEERALEGSTAED